MKTLSTMKKRKKCGYETYPTPVSYIPERDLRVDYIDHKCRRCGHHWSEKPLDRAHEDPTRRAM